MMFMSEDEIRRSYREAKFKRTQLKILSEINICSVKDIEQIVYEDIPKKAFRNLDLNDRYMLYNKGFNDREIAEILNITPAAVRYWRSKNRLKSNMTTKYNYQEIERLYKEGRSDKEIAEKLGTSPGYISSWRYRMGLKVNSVRF